MAVDVPFLGRRAREPLVRRCSRFPSLWSAVQINTTPRYYPRILELWSRFTRSRPEHENNEPALGVAKLVDERAQTRGKRRPAHCARVKWRGLEKETGIGFFATNVSAACRSRSLHTRCPPSKWGRISGRWDAMTTLFACYSRRRWYSSVKQIYEQRTKLCSRIMGSSLQDKDTLV